VDQTLIISHKDGRIPAWSRVRWMEDGENDLRELNVNL
jgi:hypothetical protein